MKYRPILNAVWQAVVFFVLLPTLSGAQPVVFYPLKFSTSPFLLANVEIAKTDAQKHKGLMYRESMPTDVGMLFVNEAPEPMCMWMKNTLLPLSVAFIDDAGRISNIEDMKPKTLDSHCSTVPAQYALEMNLGWFAKRNIRVGDRVLNLP